MTDRCERHGTRLTKRRAFCRRCYGGPGARIVRRLKLACDEMPCCGTIGMPGVFTRLELARLINMAVERAVWRKLRSLERDKVAGEALRLAAAGVKFSNEELAEVQRVLRIQERRRRKALGQA